MAENDKEHKGPDRRRAKRVRKRLKLRFWGEDDFEGRGFTHDLSLTGMLVETTSAVEIGTRLHVEVELPEDRTYYGEVAVVRKKVIPRHAQSMYKPGLGLRTVGLLEALKEGTSPSTISPGSGKGVDGRLRIDLSTRAKLQEVYDRDVKHGALRVETPRIPNVDDIVSVTLVLPDPHGSIEVVGMVVSQDRELPGFGLTIEDVDMVRARLLEILRS